MLNPQIVSQLKQEVLDAEKEAIRRENTELREWSNRDTTLEMREIHLQFQGLYLQFKKMLATRFKEIPQERNQTTVLLQELNKAYAEYRKVRI